MTAYYNDNDSRACAWLRELMHDGLIPHGEVDERSITEIEPGELKGFTQCHFFAGIGGWAYALSLAGWPADKPVWTGSCPCQPFSVAGKRKGTADERHLWPAFYRLIAECRPATVFGEQVASKLGRDWLAGVFADLEGVGYAVAGADLCAAGVGAPHIRQRLYWVAKSEYAERWPQCEGYEFDGRDAGRAEASGGAGARGENVRLADAELRRSEQCDAAERRIPIADAGCSSGGMENASRDGRRGRGDGDTAGNGGTLQTAGHGASGGGRRTDWSDAIWHRCSDGKSRRIPAEPAFFPLADGVPGRVGLLRGAGNAIVPQVAAAFIGAMEADNG